MRKVVIVAALVGVLVGGPAPALADAAEDFVKFFSINCARTVSNLEGLTAWANLKKWKKIPSHSMLPQCGM